TLIAPGRVATPFWDANGAPPAGGLLTADQIADAIVWAISQPSGVDVNSVIVRPIGQPGGWGRSPVGGAVAISRARSDGGVSWSRPRTTQKIAPRRRTDTAGGGQPCRST